MIGLGTQIEVGHKYLLFLNYKESCECFTFVKPWQIRDGKLQAVSGDDLSRLRMGTSTIHGLPISEVEARLSDVGRQ